MGWMYTQKPKGQALLDFFGEQWNGEFHEVLDVASVGWKEAYAAVRVGKGDGYTIGVALFTQYCPASYYNFGYKDMTETSGPGISRCPERILRQLTPIHELSGRGIYEGDSLAWARRWRANCWRSVAKRRRKIPFGTWIKFSSPITLGYGTEKTCYLARERYWRKRNIFKSRGGNLIRLPDWKDRRFTVVTEQEVVASNE